MTSNENILKPRTDFDDCYVYGDEIGKGRYATVKKCYCKKTDKCYAAKIIKNFRAKHAKLNLNIVENEVTALSIARCHPSIINLYEIFHHKGETILVLEYATEKDLHIYLDSEGAFEEIKACEIIYQLLKAIEFLHSKNVLHLDIKPENVLLMSPLGPKSTNEDTSLTTTTTTTTTNDIIKVKLCDFSFSQIMKPGKAILGMMGTAAYSAPEILQYEELTKATDMWSLGVLTHVILTEYTPFGNGTEENNQTQTNILSVREKDFECVEDYFDTISDLAKNFIENLLKYRPKQRLTIEQALNHEWFQMLSKNKNEINSTDKSAEQTVNETEVKLIRDDKNNNSLTSLIETFHETKLTDTKKNELKCEIKIKESSTSPTSSISNESIKIKHVNTTTSKLITNTLRSNKSASLLTTEASSSLSAKIGQVKLLKSANKSSSAIIDHHLNHQRFETANLINSNLNDKDKLHSSLTPTIATCSKVNQPKITTKLATKSNRFI